MASLKGVKDSTEFDLFGDNDDDVDMDMDMDNPEDSDDQDNMEDSVSGGSGSASSSSVHHDVDKVQVKPKQLTFGEEESLFGTGLGQRSRSGLRSSIEPSHVRVLSPTKLVSHMTERIEEVNAILQQSSTGVRQLLNQFKWDKDRLLEAYFDSEDKLDQDKGSPFSCSVEKIGLVTLEAWSALKSFDSYLCGICFEPSPQLRNEKMFGLGCGHIYCVNCWCSYIRMEILDEGKSYLGCPGFGCKTILEDESVPLLLAHSSEDVDKVCAKYQTNIINSFVQFNKGLRWCPSPSCSNVILLLGSASSSSNIGSIDDEEVDCSCGFKSCYRCPQPFHSPIKCVLLKTWLVKCADDSESYNWINTHTKDCPKCGVAIEKNGGCNHMTCKNKACGTEFCWMCLMPFKNHKECNRYNDEDGDATKSTEAGKKKEARISLERYLFYYNRYNGHERSLALEVKLTSVIEARMKEIQVADGMSWIELQFLKKALLILSQCRTTLMYTYGFAYYLQKSNEKYIFEDNQNDLELATERLSALMEHDLIECDVLDKAAVAELKRKIMDTFYYCEGRRSVLVHHVEEGYENDSWVYTTNF